MVSILRDIETVNASGLSETEKKEIFTEMELALPPEMLCRLCTNTRKIISRKLGEYNGSTKQPTSKSTESGTQIPQKSKSGEGELLLKTNANRRGTGPKKTVVKQKT